MAWRLSGGERQSARGGRAGTDHGSGWKGRLETPTAHSLERRDSPSVRIMSNGSVELWRERPMFPKLEVMEDVLFVHDGNAITSAGGAKSFEAALYLCELLYGPEVARSLAGGLVIDWKLKKVSRHITKNIRKSI